MKDLKLNPQDYEFAATAYVEGGDVTATINSNFNKEMVVTEKEAEQIGKWFLSLSKYIKTTSKRKSNKNDQEWA